MEPTPDYIHRTESEDVISQFSSGARHVHLHGGPLMLTEGVTEEIRQTGGWQWEELHARRGWDIEYLFQKMISTLEEYRSGTGKLMNRVQSISGHLSMVVGAGVNIDLDEESVLAAERLEDLAEVYSAENDLIVCIHDIDQLEEEPEVIADRLLEVAEALTESIHLLTTGERKLPEVNNVEAESISTQDAVEWLTGQISGLNPGKARNLIEKVGHHPLPLQMTARSYANSAHVPIDELSNDISDQIEEFVIRQFTPEERDVLRKTACLVEIDEVALSEVSELIPAKAAMWLSSFEERLVLKNLGRRDEVVRFRMRDHFQEFFYNRCTVSEEIHREMFQKYAQKIVDEGQFGESALSHLTPSTLAATHLGAMYDELDEEKVLEEIGKIGFSIDERLTFISGGLPSITAGIDGVEKAQYLELDRIREAAAEDDEIQREMLHSLDLGRASLRFGIASMEGLDQAEEIIEEGTEIAEKCLEYLAEEEVHREEILEFSDNPVEQLISHMKYSEEEIQNLGTLTFWGCLLCTYGKKRTGGDYEQYLQLFYVFLHEFGIEREDANYIWKKSVLLAEEIGVKEDFKSALQNNIGKLMAASGENRSPKESLLQAEDHIDDELQFSLIEFYASLYEEAPRITEYIDDIGRRLKDGEDTFPIVTGLYSISGALGLYQPIKQKKLKTGIQSRNTQREQRNQP